MRRAAADPSPRRPVELDGDGDTTVLTLTGELDVATAPELRSCITGFFQTSEGGRLVIDLGGVTFVDSTTLGVLVGAIRTAEQTHSEVVIRNQAPGIQRVFELTGLSRLLAGTTAPKA